LGHLLGQLDLDRNRRARIHLAKTTGMTLWTCGTQFRLLRGP
jgi:hypothetical protein